MKRLAPLVALLAAAPASAHAGHHHGIGWTLDASVTLPLLLAALVYAVGFWRLHGRAGRGRRALIRGAWLYAAGWLILSGALVSPLHEAGERDHALLLRLAESNAGIEHDMARGDAGFRRDLERAAEERRDILHDVDRSVHLVAIMHDDHGHAAIRDDACHIGIALQTPDVVGDGSSHAERPVDDSSLDAVDGHGDTECDRCGQHYWSEDESGRTEDEQASHDRNEHGESMQTHLFADKYGVQEVVDQPHDHRTPSSQNQSFPDLALDE